MPTWVRRPTTARPPSVAEGERCAKSPTSHSCSTMQPVFKMTPRPTRASAFTTTRAMATVPAPSFEVMEIHAVG